MTMEETNDRKHRLEAADAIAEVTLNSIVIDLHRYEAGAQSLLLVAGLQMGVVGYVLTRLPENVEGAWAISLIAGWVLSGAANLVAVLLILRLIWPISERRLAAQKENRDQEGEGEVDELIELGKTDPGAYAWELVHAAKRKYIHKYLRECRIREADVLIASSSVAISMILAMVMLLLTYWNT